ncbi:MAG: M23 family metallopeptidase [candidate division WOR-3 bacterium]|uniref:M23 family metallopeptidase n=1 Tax=candidate division WOR-3 bacterium TaxID=2052148 RepID=A0A7C1X3Z7_UNCW3|nr:M23 family metallopeptidase [candidate division WOR-3 bacterium]
MERLQVLVTLTRRNKALSLSIPLHYIYITVAVIFGFLFFSGAVTRFIITRFTQRGLLNRLIAENNILNQKLAAYTAAVDSFRQFLAFTEQMDNRFRSAVNLQLVPADVRKMGVGGYQPATVAPEVDELLRRANFARQSLLEIDRAVSTQQDRIRHLPSIWPVQGWVTSGFGNRKDPFSGRYEFHEGMDIVAPRGTPIVATADGRVISSGWRAGYGRTVEIDHGWGIRTFYAHCQTVRVSPGKMVKRGEVIATVGATGLATGNHLHYGIMVNGRWVNPADYILTPKFR